MRDTALTTRRGRVIAAMACAILLSGCSGGDGGGGEGGGFLGFGGGNEDDDLVSTDLGQGYIDGATTTIVAPPGWDGDAGASGGDGENEKKDDGGGGLFGLGGGSKGDLSQVTEASVSDVCPGSSCTIDSMDIDHPGWGPTRVFSLVEEGGDGIPNTALAAVDSTGEVKWTFVGPFSYASAWGFGTDAPDEAEALYVTYNPGRWDGVIALHPTEDGFHELPDGGGNGGYDDNGPMFLYNAFEWPRMGWVMALSPETKLKVHDGFGVAHIWASYLLYVLFFLHIAGALKHQFLDGDRELQRMLP